MDERRVWQPSDIARFDFGSSGEGGVLKAGSHEEEISLREPDAGQRLNEVVPLEGREVISTGQSYRKGLRVR